jgi:hypothetical protein
MAVAPNYRNAAGTQFPNVMTSVDGTYQVSVTIKRDPSWHLRVAKRIFATRAQTTYDLEINSTATTNGITPILSDALGGDSHYGVALTLDDQNRIWLTGNSLSTTPLMIRSASNSITSWTSIPWPYPGFLTTTGSNTTTYNIFNRLSDGRSLYLTSERYLDGRPEGAHYLFHILPLGSSTWSPLVGTGGVFATSEIASNGGVAERIYVTGMAVEARSANDRVHIWGIGRDLWDDTTTSKHPWYVYNDTVTNPATWKAIDGTPTTVPIDMKAVAGSNIEIPITNGTYSSYFSGNISIDASGYPHIILRQDNTSNWYETYYSAGAWTQRKANTSSLAPSPFLMEGGVMMLRGFSNTMRISQIPTGGTAFNIGGPITTSGTDYFAIPAYDPIQQTRSRCIHLNIPDGDTPNVCEFGCHLRSSA